MDAHLNMTQGNPLKLLFSFALPLMFGNIFQQLYTVVDIAIVGRGVGMEALAALGTVDWLNWMIIGIAFGFAQGFSVRIAQKFGERDGAGLKRYIGQSASLAILIALLVTLLSQLCLPLFLKMLRVPADLWSMAALYSRILMGGFAAIMFFNYCSAVLRAVGDSKTPLKAMIVASITNIALDCLAVFVLGWGIGGAAGATVIAQCVAGGICAHKIRKTPELRFSAADFRPISKYNLDLLKIGTPLAAKNIIIALGGVVIQAIVNGFTLSFIAGFTATNKLYGILEIAAISYGYAVTTYVGQNYGAQDLKRIKHGMRTAVFLAIGTSIAVGAIMIAFGRPITLLFMSAESPDLVAAAGNTAYLYLVVMSVSLPILYLLYVYQSALQGMGNAIIPLISGIIELFIRVSLAIAVGISGFQNGIFGAEVAAWYGSGIFLMITYYISIRSLSKKQFEQT